jgi:hypothetical protein
MGTKRPMSPNSSHPIEPCNSHCPFASSLPPLTYPPFHPPCKITNHPLVTPPILTNHTPPISSPYQPQILHVNVGSQLYTFPNPLNHAQLKHFPPPILLVLTIGHNHTPHLPPFFQQAFNLHLKSCAPCVGANLITKG